MPRKLIPLVCLALAAGALGARADEPRAHVAMVGDVLFARYRPAEDPTCLRCPTGNKRYDPVSDKDNPFEEVPSLARADLAFGNLEGPMMEEPKRFSVFGVFTFRSNPERAKALVAGGFDGMSLANNHIMNLGAIGGP